MKRQGFTLVEILIAVIISSISILGLGVLLLKSVEFVKKSEYKIECAIATYKAECLLNYLVSFPYNDTILENGTSYFCCINGTWCSDEDKKKCCNDNIKDFMGDDFCGNFTISYLVNETEENIKKVMVIVEFKNGNCTLEQLKGKWQ